MINDYNVVYTITVDSNLVFFLMGTVLCPNDQSYKTSQRFPYCRKKKAR